MDNVVGDSRNRSDSSVIKIEPVYDGSDDDDPIGGGMRDDEDMLFDNQHDLIAPQICIIPVEVNGDHNENQNNCSVTQWKLKTRTIFIHD